MKQESNCKEKTTGKDKTTYRSSIKNIFSLVLCTAALAACNSIEETAVPSGEQPLNLSVNVHKSDSRAIITGNALPDASQIGVFVTDNAGADYNNRGYANVLYTTSGSDCTSQTDVFLDSKVAKLYAYYPYDENNADMTAIPVESSTLTDYMYATSGNTELSNTNASVALTMNHILTGIKVSIKKTDENTDYTASKIKVSSQGIAKGAKFDLTDASLFGFTGQNEAIIWDDAIALTTEYQSTGIEYFVSTGTEEPIKFLVTVDGNDYSLTSTQTLAMGKVYDFKLEFDNAGLNANLDVTGVTVNGYGDNSFTVGTVEPILVGPEVDITGKDNGVYAVTATGQLIPYNDAAVNSTCIGVALITDNQKIMIENNREPNTASMKAANRTDGADDDESDTFYWGMNGSDTTIDNIIDAEADFEGKAHTTKLVEAVDTDGNTEYANMGTYCIKFNDTPEENLGYDDWYIPAMGQLYEIYTNKTNINAALTAMGGQELKFGYWSSSETDGEYAWCMPGGVDAYCSVDKKNASFDVLFVRDL